MRNKCKRIEMGRGVIIVALYKNNKYENKRRREWKFSVRKLVEKKRDVCNVLKSVDLLVLFLYDFT